MENIFRFILGKRWWVVGVFALIMGPAIWFALRVGQDNSVDRLIVESDPDAIAARKFDAVFGGGQYVVLIADAPDPYAPALLAKLDALEQSLAKLPKIETHSALSIFRRVKGGFDSSQAAEFRTFATGTDLFRKQGLVGDGFIAIPLILDVKGTEERHAAVAAVDKVLAAQPLTGLHKVGQPYVDEYLDAGTRAAGQRYFPLFGIFVILINLFLYRSFRTLCAFLAALAASAALTVGFVGVTGGVFTIVSSLVPMTVLISCASTLVYIHSRYVDRPPERSEYDHLVFTLSNKFLACTASLFAAAVGFAALAVSEIRPIRAMGLWVAVGLVFTWLTTFTLFPSLQMILKAPTKVSDPDKEDWFVRTVDRIPRWSYRYRWLFVPLALFMSGLGAVALFGIPKLLAPMKMQTAGIEYIDHDSTLYRDTKQFESRVGGLSLTQIWLAGKKTGEVTDGPVMRGIDAFERELALAPHVGSVVGLASLTRSIGYSNHQGDQLPTTDSGLDAATATLETLIPQERMLQRYIDAAAMNQTHVDVITSSADWKEFQTLDESIQTIWKRVVALHPALADFELKTVGMAPLQAKISYHLVPTLVKSFGLTVLIIFSTFLIVFRNGAARVMAMIPSLFAILVMFLVMRLSGATLNVATILIASTVLGTSENDQIHFFYHFAEGKKSGDNEAALRHTLRIAGRAIAFATLINAGGFLAFALSNLPPIRQFGSLSSVAFVLSMIADFTALPAALWLIFRDRPTKARQNAAVAVAPQLVAET